MEIMNLAVAITALIAACGAAFWAGRIEGKLTNGMMNELKSLRADMNKILARLDQLPCAVHQEQLKHFEESLARLEQRA